MPGEAGLPKFFAQPDGLIFSDVRMDKREGTKYFSWTCKQYSGALHWEKSRSVTEGDTRIDTFLRKYRREIYLIKWHSFGLLEVRVPIGSSSSHSRLRDQKDSLLGMLKLALPQILLTPLDLRPAVKRFAAEAYDGAKWLRFNSPSYDVDGHSVSVSSATDAENVFESKSLAAAHKILEQVAEGRIVILLPDGQVDLPQQITVDLCMSFPNEFKIAGQTTPEAIEFIIRRLWERLRKDPLPPSLVDSDSINHPEHGALAMIDFDAFARRFPGVANAIWRIKSWAQSHPSSELLHVDRLSAAMGGGISRSDIAVALGKMVEEGILTQKYRLRVPHQKNYLPQVFDSMDEISDAKDLVDRHGNPVNLDDVHIVSVFGLPATEKGSSGE
jgi:hypothetical protein